MIFTDESKIEVGNVSNRCYRKKGELVPRIAKAKHPYSTMVWGGISKRGATPLLIFNGIMDSQFYQQSILKNAFLPFVKVAYPTHHRLWQDNDPKHTSKSTKQFMEENGINWFPTPAESPDLNPIENLWHEMKHYCKVVRKASNKAELEDAIHAFWATCTPGKCQKYIGHLKKVVPAVIRCNGSATGF